MLPKLLHGLNAFIDGEEFIGTAVKVEPSLPKPRVKEVSSPGLAGTIDIPTSKWQKSEPKITLHDYPPTVLGLVGHSDTLTKTLNLIGVMAADDSRTVEIEVTGLWKEPEGSEWADDADAAYTFVVSARTYLLRIDGSEVLYIDYERNIVRQNGEAVTSALNVALRNGS